jgi:NitT/TauT family transport system ATP-binding protein
MKLPDLKKADSAWPVLNASDGRPAGDPGTAFLSVREIGKTYTSRGSDPHEAIREISFEAREREFVCVVGPSGAGKTTLLRCLAGLLPPTKGTVFFGQRPVTAPPPEVAVVFQDYSRSLFPWLTVAGNIALPLKTKRLPRAERARLVTDSLSAVNLDGSGHRYPWQLSGGMQQRVAIARALAYQPRLLLMDEPFASVDAQTRFELEDLVLRVREEFGMSIIFVTHDIDEAVYLGDRIIALSKSPCVVTRDLPIDLGPARNQLETRADPRFIKLRTEVLKLVTGQNAPAVGAAGATGADR